MFHQLVILKKNKMVVELPEKFIGVMAQKRQKETKGRVPLEGRKPFFLGQARVQEAS